MELQLLGDTCCDVVQDGDGALVEKVVANLVVHNTVRSKDMSRSTLDGHLCIRYHMRKPNDIWAVFVLIQLSQIADHVASGIGDNIMGVDGSAAGTVGENGDGLWTDSILLVQALHT
jgi:hypothetical protein